MHNKDTCALCGSGDAQVVSTKLRHEKAGVVVRCGSCGLVRLRGAQEYAAHLNQFYAEQYAQQYYSGIKGELDSLFESFLPVQGHRVDKVAPFLRSTDRVLEVGSGPGYFLTSIRDRVAEIQGLELNRKEAAYAASVRAVPTSTLPHETSDLPRGHYDHLFLFQVLEHAANPVRFLTELKSFLRPGAHLHIEVPNVLDPLVAFYDVAPYRDFYYQEPHLYYFSPETLTNVCAAAGFEIKKVQGFQQTSVINHLHWLFARGPQASRWDCIQSRLPAGSVLDSVDSAGKKALEVLLSEFNQSYQRLLEQHGFSDMVFATIKVPEEVAA
jgi:2-polyprenyl-3-methyl-5-hydroxy-6-metoxy-1,4-benzoquinol methylase